MPNFWFIVTQAGWFNHVFKPHGECDTRELKSLIAHEAHMSNNFPKKENHFAHENCLHENLRRKIDCVKNT